MAKGVINDEEAKAYLEDGFVIVRNMLTTVQIS